MSSLPSQPVPSNGSGGSRLAYLLGTVAVVAVTAGIIAGITWSGGGRWALAENKDRPARFAAVEPGRLVTASPGSFQGAAPASMADLVEHVSPAVVTVKVKVNQKDPLDELRNSPFRDFFEQFERRRGQGGGGEQPPSRPRPRKGEVQGSGFVISADGYIVTNNHVVDDSTEIEVEVGDGKSFKAKVIGRDEATDIALLKIEAPKPLPTVTFGDDKKVRVGDWVLAVGNPFGLGGTVTAGIISARGRDIGSGPYTDYLQIDAAINRGNSGGPTFDMQGRVIGMNTAIFSPSGGSVGIGFAIPASIIQDVVADLRKDGAVQRGWLGVQIRSLDEDLAYSLGLQGTKGAFVTTVVEKSPAESAGFKEQDVVLELNGEQIDDSRDMTRKVGQLADGATATFIVWRDGKKLTLKATVGKRDEQNRVSQRDKKDEEEGKKAKVADLGLGVSPLTNQMRDEYNLENNVEGVVITDIEPESDAAEKGLREGERITGIGQSDVNTIADLERGLDQATKSGRKSVLLKIENSRGSRYVAVRIGRG